jgi:hypothetical protein
MKKKCAIFTIVKNENYFLPIWLKYYKTFFDNEDIFILDHESNDGSTENLDVNVLKIYNDLAFDHQWLVDTVQNFQKELLEKYECVIFAESDELIYSLKMDLGELIDTFVVDKNINYVSLIGFEVIQDLENELPLKPNDLIFENRNLFFKYPIYDKTLISKIPLKWEWGFHRCNHPQNYIYDTHLMHLHRVDFDLMLKRHEERAKKWNLKNDGDSGHQHRIGDKQGVLDYFNNIPSSPIHIPEEHKKQFFNI